MSPAPTPPSTPTAAAPTPTPAAVTAMMPHGGLRPDPEDARDKDMLDLPIIRHLARAPGSLLYALSPQGVNRPPITMATTGPAALSLRDKCGQVQDQGNLNACTAHAAAALMELVQAHLNDHPMQGSRMFLYKVERALLGYSGDSGAYLRTAAGALTLFGLPPEQYWQYDLALLDVEPTPFCYQLGQRYRASSYFRVDSNGVSPEEVVLRIKSLLQKGLPSMFGYTVYFGAEFQAHATGGIPLPLSSDIKVGGHALMICGYDDAHVITNVSTDGATSTGAFQIQNSRGVAWGDQGFGWIPYDYFLKDLATDVWSVVNADWVNIQPFEAGEVTSGAPAT